jgi:cation:H+ antiporter
MILFTIVEMVAAILGFFVAAELTAIGTDRIEPLVGQGMAGGVVLGLLGALPETVFVVVATLSGSYDVAVGSAIGGNIILFTLGIGVLGILYAMKWKGPIKMKGDYRVELWFLLGSTVALVLLMLYGSLDRLTGLLLFVPYLAYIAYRYASAHRMIRKNAGTAEGKRRILKALAYIFVGMLLIAPLSDIFVGLISSLSSDIGISALWIALVIVPIASDLDENISGYRILSKSRWGGSTAIVSFIGSKLQNNTMLLGLIGLLAMQPIALASARFSLSAVIMVNLIAIVVVIRGKFTVRESVLLIAAYVSIVAAAFVF